MGANQEIIAELRRVLNERDEAREQLDLTKRELGRWVDRETKAVRERDEAREERDLARERFENAVQSATRYAVERDEWRDKFHALNQTAGELCNACGWSFKLPGEPCRCEIVKERDEARAEVEHAYREGGALYEAKIAEREAFRSGAEAMRARCEELVKHNSHEDGIGMGSQRIESAIRALTISEEP